MAKSNRPPQDKSPPGFLRFSEATKRLAAGMWGGLPQPISVKQIKKADWSAVLGSTAASASRNISVGFGPWREHARKRLTRAAVDGELPVYATVDNTEPLVMPTDVLPTLPKSRGGLGDVSPRVPLKVARKSEALFKILTTGRLVVRETDFWAWYEAERARGLWPSQRSRSKIHGGRPTKHTERLRSLILELVHDGKWRADAPIAALHRILCLANPDIPSADTLGRLVDQLFLETGEPGLRRPSRRGSRRNA